MGLGSLVLVEIALSLEADATGGAGIWPLPSVAAEVLLQDAGLQAIPSTVRAHVLPCRLGSGCVHWSFRPLRLDSRSAGYVQRKNGQSLVGAHHWQRQRDNCSILHGCRLARRACRQPGHGLDVHGCQWGLNTHLFLPLHGDRMLRLGRYHKALLASCHGNSALVMFGDRAF